MKGKEMQMKVLFLTNIPSPYRVDFFNAWGKLCDLTVTFEGTYSKERDTNWKASRITNFKALFLKGLRTKADQFLCPGILPVIKKKYDHVIVGGYSTPTAMLAILFLQIRKIPFWIEADGGLIHPDSTIKFDIKRHFISSATGWLSSGQTTTKYLTHYGADPACVQWYPFTSLHEKDILMSPVDKCQKKSLRECLSIQTDRKVVLSVGQFIPRKGFDVLLRAISQCSKEYLFYIVGADPTEEYLGLKSKLCLENVHFVGFQKKSELKKYYQASDLFVLPTREDIWGLVINEAMANGLPVITTDQCVAGLELVENSVNGYIVPVDNEKKLAEQITKVLNDDLLRAKMANASIARIRPYTIENMAFVHNEILKSGGRLPCNKTKQ